MAESTIDISSRQVEAFCRKWKIREFSLFGSVLRDDFGPDSDIDVLVEFEPGARVGLIKLAGVELDLTELLGRKVDLNTPGFLSDAIRDRVGAEAKVQYDAA